MIGYQRSVNDVQLQKCPLIRSITCPYVIFSTSLEDHGTTMQYIMHGGMQ